MIVWVHYHDSAFKKIDEQVELPDSATVKDLLQYLGVSILKTAVINGRVARLEAVLTENAEVFLFGQMAGG